MPCYRSLAITVATLALAACATQPPGAIVATTTPPPAVAIVQVTAPPPLTPINRGLTTQAAIWHVRAGLNVAALACRGAAEAGIVARYNAMLTTNAAPLKAAEAALAAQFRAGGGDWQDRYDDAMTRLYNFFSQAQGRTLFCATAEAALAEAPTTAEGWPAYAERWLPALDVAFSPLSRPQVIAVASSPPMSRATIAQPAPRLTLDLSNLPQE